MGKFNVTHVGKQKIVECPECPRRIRLGGRVGISKVRCGDCGEWFEADRETGEVLS